ncbi:MAG: DNA polymerase III subunit delta [Myxococcales bacterium]|nr:DNA polymerase III subunit delta [Myxococcales bacterium]
MATFDEKLDPQALAPIYILVSQESLLLSRAHKALLEASVPEELRGFNCDQLQGKGADASQLLAAAQTLPMMAARRFLLVRGLEGMAAAELSKLVPYLESPNPSTVLVALCEKVDKRIKFFQHAKKLGFLQELGAPRSLGPWIREEARRQGVNLASAAADRLGHVVGADLARLGLAIEQLSLYAGERAIEVDDVDDLVADTRERSVFELTDAIASRNQGRAQEAVAGLFEQRQSSIGVVMMLARHMRQLGLCQAGQQQHLGKGELAKKVGVPPFVLDKLSRQAAHYSVRGVAQSLTLLGEADRALKGVGASGKVLGRTLAERVVVEVLVRDLIGLASR